MIQHEGVNTITYSFQTGVCDPEKFVEFNVSWAENNLVVTTGGKTLLGFYGYDFFLQGETVESISVATGYGSEGVWLIPNQ